MSKVLKNVKIASISIFHWLRYRLKYRNQIKMKMINSIRGKFLIELENSRNRCNIGRFLMTRGPLYMKCINEAQIEIGDNCFFNHNCSITASTRISIGNDCMFANNLVMIDHNHKIEGGRVLKDLDAEAIIIEDNVWCGANVTILKGVHIGEGAVIAAGAVVANNVPSYAVLAGVPGRVIRYTK